jgi:hypothetical protein
VVTFDDVGQALGEARGRGETILVLLPVETLGDGTQWHIPELDVIGNNGRVALVAVKAVQIQKSKGNPSEADYLRYLSKKSMTIRS